LQAGEGGEGKADVVKKVTLFDPQGKQICSFEEPDGIRLEDFAMHLENLTEPVKVTMTWNEVPLNG
jgi:hypothetical protein